MSIEKRVWKTSLRSGIWDVFVMLLPVCQLGKDQEKVYSAHASFSITPPPPSLLSSPSFASLISHSVSPPLFSLEVWDKLEE